MTSVVPAESAEPQKVAPGAPRSRLALALKPSAQLMQTLLFHASAGDPVRVVDRLDEDGVDVRQGDAFGNTLLHWAASRNCLPLATALLSRGDPTRADLVFFTLFRSGSEPGELRHGAHALALGSCGGPRSHGAHAA